ncbi:MAG: hypothetical protein DWH91_13415 [Planctomycetota bacterium]|nr:MAG: hypothetical protein DWH91_13415 [Planctomycetota bacterium]
MHLNLSTRELDRVQLKLRDDLMIRPMPSVDGATYQIEDPVAVRFYRVGQAEYLLLSLLDGRTTLAEAVSISARQLGRDAFSEQEATSVAIWLVDTGLVTPTEGTSPAKPQASTSLASWFNPFWMKWPLLKPEGLLDLLLPATRWLFSAPALLAMVILWITGVVAILGQWEPFWNDTRHIFSSNNWMTLAAVWLGLKVVHELGHGLCCRAHGGRVTEMGVVFVLLAPMAYVDVTSTWGFRSRWNRMHVAAAGMIIELSIAAMAALFWGESSSPFMRQILHNVIISASLTTLLFNLNPLMRFDGYFLLEDLLDIPNLGTTAARWSHAKAARIFYGDHRPVPLPAGWIGGIVRSYALGASIWRLLVTGSLLTGAAIMFHGAGLILAVAAIGLWYVKPAVETLMTWIQRWSRDRLSATRAALLSTSLTIFVASALFWLPSPFQRRAPAIVEYADLATVRIDAPGFVETVHVINGQVVDAGTLIIRLRNEELTARVTDLELAILQSIAKRTSLMNRREVAAAQIERRQQQALEEQLAESQRKAETLNVRAPVAGRVLARRLPDQVGNYLKSGVELLVIGDENHKELIASVDQRDLEAFSDQSTATGRIRVCGLDHRTTSQFHVEPRASTRLPHPALAATHGGMVDVVADEGKPTPPGGDPGGV